MMDFSPSEILAIARFLSDRGLLDAHRKEISPWLWAVAEGRKNAVLELPVFFRARARSLSAEAQTIMLNCQVAKPRKISETLQLMQFKAELEAIDLAMPLESIPRKVWLKSQIQELSTLKSA